MDKKRLFISLIASVVLTGVLIAAYKPLMCEERDAPICIEGEKPNIFSCEMNCDEGDGIRTGDFLLPAMKALVSVAIIATSVYFVHGLIEHTKI